MTTVSIPSPDGSRDIDVALFSGYKDEANEYFRTLEDAAEELKELIDTIAKSTGLKKGFVKKYLKARYDEKTEAAVAEGKGFAALDEALA